MSPSEPTYKKAHFKNDILSSPWTNIFSLKRACIIGSQQRQGKSDIRVPLKFFYDCRAATGQLT